MVQFVPEILNQNFTPKMFNFGKNYAATTTFIVEKDLTKKLFIRPHKALEGTFAKICVKRLKFVLINQKYVLLNRFLEVLAFSGCMKGHFYKIF